MRTYKKRAFPVGDVRRYLEPGPVVLISSMHRGARTIMTCGWHMVMEMEPSRVGCYIWAENRSRALIKGSRECVINIPTAEMLDTVIDIGNHHGDEFDKFDAFGLTPLPASKVKAPLIAECFASFECKVIDSSLVNRYSLFVFEVVRAHVATSPRYPTTLHYRGGGMFMVSGKNVNRRRRFLPENLN